MNERERDAAVRRLYDLQLALFEQHGEEIKALRSANGALQKSHARHLLRVMAALRRAG